MRRTATRPGGAANGSWPPIRWRTRARNCMRWLRYRWGRSFPRPAPAWTGPVVGDVPTAPPSVGESQRIEITVTSVGELRAQLSDADLAGAARSVDVVVTDWKAPWQGWSGRLGPLPGLVRHSVSLPARGPGTATVHVTLDEPLVPRKILAAVLALLEPWHPLSATASADVSVLGDKPPWLRPDPWVDYRRDDGVIPPSDVALTGSWYGVAAAGENEVILADATAANPRGRPRYSHGRPAGVLSLVGGADGPWWQICRETRGSTTVVAGRVGYPFDERQTDALARLGSVVVGTTPFDVPPAAQAVVIAQLAMSGVTLHTRGLPDRVGELLTSELVALLEKSLPGREADPIEWEICGIAQRRAALRGHAVPFALQAALARVYPSMAHPPAVSALLVTRRPHQVGRALAALATQSYPELEIVVGLHGFELPSGERDRLTIPGVPVRVLLVPEELSLGEALAVVTRAATGSLITKVDDDDRYGPEHIWDLVLARHYSGATMVGKGAEFVYLEQYDTTVRRRMASELYTDVVAGGTMLLSRGDLENVGGWRPLRRSVDRGLQDRVLQAGGLIYRTHGFGFVYARHSDGHTWDPGLRYFLLDPLRQWRGLPPYGEFG